MATNFTKKILVSALDVNLIFCHLLNDSFSTYFLNIPSVSGTVLRCWGCSSKQV